MRAERTSQKPRILYIWPYLEWGGAQIYFTGIMKHIRNQYEVLAAMPEGSDGKLLGYLDRLGVKTEFFGAHLDNAPARSIGRKIQRRIADARCAFIIARHLSRRGYKNILLHADFGPWSFFYLLLYLTLRTHVVVTLHIAIPELPLLRRLEWRLKFRILSWLPRFHLLASNQDMQDSLKPFLSARFLRTVLIAYTGVDEAEIGMATASGRDRRAICERFQLPQNRFLVFSLGQLIQRKGCLVLLEAARQLQACHPELFFVWIGDGNLRQEFEARIASAGLQNSVRLITPMEIGPDRLDLLHLLCAADLFVLASYSEGLPGALLEAMALGKACIASNVNAIPEVIRDDETGVLVPAGNPDSLAEAIVSLAQDPIRRQTLAAAGRSVVMSNFTEAKAARITAACYSACLGCR